MHYVCILYDTQGLRDVSASAEAHMRMRVERVLAYRTCSVHGTA